MADEGRFSGSKVRDYSGAASNPAAPGGLRQIAREAQAVQSGEGRFADSYVGQYAIDEGTLATSKSWYGGANMEGVSNSWDTGFMREAYKQFNEQQTAAAEAQDQTKFYDWFDRDDATGVAMWDDEGRGIKRGDVFNAGKKVANVYDDFDDPTANVLMADFLLDAKTKAKIFADSDRDRWLKDEVTAVLDENTKAMKQAADQVEFAGDVNERQAELLEGGSQAGIVAGGAGGGAVVGAGIGSIVPVVGTAAGAAAGAVVGGVSAWLNRDQLSEQTARAIEITSRANARYEGMDQLAAIGIGAKEFGGVGMRFISPFSNTVQGLYDARAGKGGDGESEFYAVDEDGKRKVSTWVRGADLAATLADGASQFGSKAGVRAYLAATGATVSGQVTALGVTGERWDDREVDFTDPDGAKEWSATIGAVGIDAVQMGFGAAIARSGVAARAALSPTTTPAASRGMLDFSGRIPKWNRDVVGTRQLEGRKFGFDEAGNVIASRPTLGVFVAPSETLRYTAANWKARTKYATAATPGPDDYYRAALEMAGGRGVGAALVNGWAESAEEAVQGILEPVSFSADVDPWQVLEQAAYGFAGGAGMSLGKISRPPSRDDVAFSRASVLFEKRTGVPLTKEMWDGLSEQDRRAFTIADADEAVTIRDGLATMAEAQRIDKGRSSVIGTMAAKDMETAAFLKDTASVNPAADGTLVMGGMSTDRVYAIDETTGERFIDSDLLRADSAVSSLWQTLNLISNKATGLSADLEDKNARLASLAPDDVEAIAALTAERDLVARSIEMNANIRRELMRLYNDYRAGTDVARREEIIDEVNGYIRDAVEGRLVDEAGQPLQGIDAEAARRAVEVMFTRHPGMEAGSFPVLVPQASKALTRANAHGQVLTHQSILKAMGGDRDGDTMVSQHFVVPPQAQLDELRAGLQFTQAAEVEEIVGQDAQGNDIVETKTKRQVVTDPPDGEKHFVRWLSEGLNAKHGSDLHRKAESTVLELVADLRDRYLPTVPAADLDRILGKFQKDLVDGNPDARLNLANTLFAEHTEAMLLTAKRERVPEVPWLMQRISRAWAQYQQDFAAEDPQHDFAASDIDAPLPQEKAFQRAHAIQRAATAGQTMELLVSGNVPVRVSQKFHYSIFRSLVDAQLNPGFLDTNFEYIRDLYAQLGSDLSQSAREQMEGRNAIQRRVYDWLNEIVQAAGDTFGPDANAAILLLANTRVADIRITGVGQYERADGDISLLQLFLKRSIEIEEQANRATIESDPDLQKKIRRLKRLSEREVDDKNRSTTSQLALLEVLGDVPMYNLIGESARHLGAQLTPNQLVAQLTNRSRESRKDQVNRWRRKADYVMHASVGNPPYTVQEITSEAMSPFRVLVDTIAASTRVAPRERRAQDARVLEEFKTGISHLQSLVANYRRAKELDLDDRATLEQMLEKDLTFAHTLAKLLPEASRRGAIQIINGRGYASNWVMDMLFQDPAKAAVTYRVNTWIAEWNALGGNADLSELETKRFESPAKREEWIQQQIAATRQYSKLNSRMLRVFSQVAQQPTDFEWNRLMRTLATAPSVESMMEVINSQTQWVGDQGEMYAFYDDVADFDPDPSQVWTANLPGTLQREAISAFAARAKMLSEAQAVTDQKIRTERNLLSAVRAFLDTGTDRDQGRKYHDLLKLTIENRRLYPDHIGAAVRDRFTRAIQEGVLRFHDKGKADRNIAPFGEFLVTADEFGVKQSVFQTADGLTIYDADDILTNPTKVVEGPIRVAGVDGEVVLLDLTTVEGALEALENPRTNAFAKMVLFPVARELNANDVLSPRLDVNDDGLKSMLDDASMSSLFPRIGERPSLAQAHKFISMVEAGIRRKNIGLSREEQDAAYFPIQQVINEFAVAYTHGAGASKMNKDDIRAGLFIDVAHALMQMGRLHQASPNLVEEVKDAIKASLKNRFARDTSGLKKILAGELDKATEDLLLLDAFTAIFTRRSLELSLRNTDPNLTPEERAAVQAEMDALNEEVQLRINQVEGMVEDDIVQSAINMFTPSGDPAGDLTRKGAILEFLGTANRKNRFQGPYALMERLNTVLAEDQFNVSNPDAFSLEEWQELGLWASTIYMAERVGRAGSNVDLTPLLLGPEGKHNRRFFDYTWSYLVDGLADPKVLDVVANMTTQAGWTLDFTPAEVAGRIESTLLSEKKLGEWTELVVSKSLHARQALSQASVGLAIPVGGDLPKELAAYVGAGRRTFRVPTPDMVTTNTFTIDPVTGDVSYSPVDKFKLDRHFARSVRVIGTDDQGQPIDVELIGRAGASWHGDAAVRDSEYKFLRLETLEREIDRVLQGTTVSGELQLQVEYLDVDSMPYAEEWKNNVFFEGVGREGEVGLTASLVAEQVFGVGALSKTSQQNPLDQATRGGASYMATPLTSLETATRLESSNRVADVLLGKALHMQAKKYDVGQMLDGDLNSFYSLMKMRHVVVGTNAQGEKEVWWSHRAIAEQHKNPAAVLGSDEFPLRDAKLVQLSDAWAQSLLGEPGGKGVPGVVSESKLNLSDMALLPEITPERLAAANLTKLGEEGSLTDTALADLVDLPKTTKVNDSGRVGATPYEAKIFALQETQSETRYARQSNRGRGFDPSTISETSVRKLQALLGPEALAPLFARLGIPYTDVIDLQESALTESLLNKIRQLAEVDADSVIWQHVHDGTPDPSAGVFTEVATKNNFEDVPKHARPVLGDTVVLDLDSFLRRTGGDNDLALDLATDVVRKYAQSGARIVLAGAANGSLRAALGDYLRSGADGYRQMAESSHFFAPIYQDDAISQNRRSLDSTLTATRVFTGDSLILTHESDYYGDGATENVSYFDLRPEQQVWRADALTLLPTHFGMYGVPVQGNDALNQMAEVKDKVLKLLGTAAGRKHLRTLSGGDPDGVPIHSIVNGVEQPGIRSLDAAMDRLEALLTANQYPLREGAELMMGDLIPVVAPDKTIVFVRVGFHLPDGTELPVQLATPIDPNDTAKEPGGFAIAPAKLQETWTVRPPAQIVAVHADPLVGASVQVKYDLSRYGKGVAEGDGWKTLYAPMPDDLAAPAEPVGRNGIRFNAFTSRKGREGKQATEGQLTSFDWAFAFSGISFRQEMVEFFLGKKQRSPEKLAEDWAVVHTFLKKVEEYDHGFTASELQDFLGAGQFMSAFAAQLNEYATEVFGKGFNVPLTTPGTKAVSPVERLAEVMLVSIMAPRVRVEDVIETSGLVSLEDLNGGSKITLMPRIFTDNLEDYAYPQLREYLMNKVNAQLPRRPDGTMPYFLKNDWQFYIEMQNPVTGKPQHVPGVAQISLEFAADENPVNYVQSAVRSARQGASQHVSFVANEAISARTVMERDLRASAQLFDETGIERFDGSLGDGGFFQMMHAVPKQDRSYKPWMRRTPLQKLHMMEARKRQVAYYRPIDQSEWTDEQKASYATLQNRILSLLVGNQAEKFRTDIDYLVRQFFGIAGAREGQDPSIGRVSPEAAVQAAQLILGNVENNMIPTAGGVVALWDAAFAGAVYEANLHRGVNAWAPRLGPGQRGKEAPLASSWDEWTKATFGQVRESEEIFDTTFRYDLDGFFHTWQNATEDLSIMAVSMDAVLDKKLMDAEANKAIASLDPNQEILLTEPAIFDSMRATLDTLVGENPEYRAQAARSVPKSELAQRIEKHVAWHAGKRIPKQEGRLSYRKYMEEGSWYLESSRDTHSFFHNLVNLSVGMRLLNPALWTSAVLEVFVRNKMETFTNLVTGRSTSIVGQGLAKMGAPTVYSPEQIAKLQSLANTMGQDNRFLAMVYDELTYKNLVEEGRGKVGRGLEKFAKFSATATSDPHFGMKARSLAMRYLDAAVEYLESTDTAVSFDTFIAAMNRDPRWLRDQLEGTNPLERRGPAFNAHRAGMNRIAQVRSMRQTALGKTIMSPIDLMAGHDKWAVNATGTLLKLPFLFTRFNVNAFLAMSGMSGVDQLAAMWLDGRKSKVVGRMKWAMTGGPYDPEMDRMDFSDVLEGVDLFRPFIRGAVTHTGLMAFGMMANGLGLSGEDEEMKRRRRLSQLLDLPYMYDPRRVENDVTMVDGIFLDAFPKSWQSMFQVSVDDEGNTRSAIMPHWIVRQFLSPVIGIERFFSTGDPRQIAWGYGDAFAAIPTSVSRIKQEADVTAGLLLEESAKAAGLTSKEADASTTQLLINIVGIYERALLENSFVNSVRSGFDDYNRNPWIKPEVNKFGEIVRDPQTGAPIPSTQKELVLEDGTIQTQYDTRGNVDAQLHQFAENNATAALLLSLFTGQWSTDSTYLRDNMAPKQETMYLPEQPKEKGEATLMAALRGQMVQGKGLENVSMYEIEKTLKMQVEAAGGFWNQAEITAEAHKIYERMNAQGQTGGLSLIDEKSGQLLKDGARGVLEGLWQGTVNVDDESLIGINISVPMRQQIQEEWTEELIQDGIDLGLPEAVAVSRARRIWYGNTYEDPNATGLKDIVWDDRIPWNMQVTYNQLNTTFVMGPNGRPLATPFTRQNLAQALGIPLPSRAWSSTAGMTKDMRGNAVDEVAGINLGLKGLERVDSKLTMPVPEDEPKAFKETGRTASDPFADNKKKGSGWVNYGKRGYTPYRRRSYGGGGGYSSKGYPNFTRMYALPDTQTPYGNDIPFINTSNPILRRADVRRERVWSERGRLNQWQ